MNKGKELEILIETIERALHDFPGAEVIRSTYLVDGKGVRRQIDILIKIKIGNHEFITIMECKNKTRKVDVGTVGAFKDLVASLNVHEGIIVSASGFQKGAMQSVEKTRIRLYHFSQLQEIEKHFRDLPLNFYFMEHKMKDLFATLSENDGLYSVNENTELFAPDANRNITIKEMFADLTNINRGPILRALLKRSADPEDTNTRKGNVELFFEPNRPFVIQTERGTIFMKSFRITTDSIVTTKPLQIDKAYEYREFNKKESLALIAEVKLDEQMIGWINKSQRGF